MEAVESAVIAPPIISLLIDIRILKYKQNLYYLRRNKWKRKSLAQTETHQINIFMKRRKFMIKRHTILKKLVVSKNEQKLI